jgi:hypothetical protein
MYCQSYGHSLITEIPSKSSNKSLKCLLCTKCIHSYSRCMVQMLTALLSNLSISLFKLGVRKWTIRFLWKALVEQTSYFLSYFCLWLAVYMMINVLSWIPHLNHHKIIILYLHTIYVTMALQPFVVPWPLFTFLILYTVGRTPWTGDQLVARLPLPVHRTQTQTSMPRVGFEPTIIALERAERVHGLDREATVIGLLASKVSLIRGSVSCLLPSSFFFGLSSTLQTEAICPPEKPVDFHRTTRPYVTEIELFTH